MTSYEFEVAAKNAVIKRNLDCNEFYKIQDISIVWHAYILGYQKAILIDNGDNKRLYEVTYSPDRDEMYLDEYEKAENIVFDAGMIDTQVHK